MNRSKPIVPLKCISEDIKPWVEAAIDIEEHNAPEWIWQKLAESGRFTCSEEGDYFNSLIVSIGFVDMQAQILGAQSGNWLSDLNCYDADTDLLENHLHRVTYKFQCGALIGANELAIEARNHWLVDAIDALTVHCGGDAEFFDRLTTAMRFDFSNIAFENQLCMYQVFDDIRSDAKSSMW